MPVPHIYHHDGGSGGFKGDNLFDYFPILVATLDRERKSWGLGAISGRGGNDQGQ
jgi:hypothetical protein